jgi:hypothetical protein
VIISFTDNTDFSCCVPGKVRDAERGKSLEFGNVALLNPLVEMMNVE